MYKETSKEKGKTRELAWMLMKHDLYTTGVKAPVVHSFWSVQSSQLFKSSCHIQLCNTWSSTWIRTRTTKILFRHQGDHTNVLTPGATQVSVCTQQHAYDSQTCINRPVLGFWGYIICGVITCAGGGRQSNKAFRTAQENMLTHLQR